jgi:hypothetical protein
MRCFLRVFRADGLAGEDEYLVDGKRLAYGLDNSVVERPRQIDPGDLGAEKYAELALSGAAQGGLDAGRRLGAFQALLKHVPVPLESGHALKLLIGTCTCRRTATQFAGTCASIIPA